MFTFRTLTVSSNKFTWEHGNQVCLHIHLWYWWQQRWIKPHSHIPVKIRQNSKYRRRGFYIFLVWKSAVTTTENLGKKHRQEFLAVYQLNYYSGTKYNWATFILWAKGIKGSCHIWRSVNTISVLDRKGIFAPDQKFPFAVLLTHSTGWNNEETITAKCSQMSIQHRHVLEFWTLMSVKSFILFLLIQNWVQAVTHLAAVLCWWGVFLKLCQ